MGHNGNFTIRNPLSASPVNQLQPVCNGPKADNEQASYQQCEPSGGEIPIFRERFHFFFLLLASVPWWTASIPFLSLKGVNPHMPSRRHMQARRTNNKPNLRYFKILAYIALTC